MGAVTVRTHLEVEVEIRGTYKPGAAPLPMRGEAVAVECPGWPEHIEDLEVLLSPGVDIADHLSEGDRDGLEEQLIQAARDELERREEP